jgi:hypothetical protein
MKKIAAGLAAISIVLPASAIPWHHCETQTNAPSSFLHGDGVAAELAARLPIHNALPVVKNLRRRRLDDDNNITTTNNQTTENVQYTSHCAYLKQPLLHPGFAATAEIQEEARHATVSVFIKRTTLKRNATTAEAKPKKALWFLQGGPGVSSAGTIETLMEWAALELQDQHFDLYTMDHRGVARSTRLGCTAAQAEEDGSIEGETISDSELKSCVEAMNEPFETFKYNHAFSSTAAANDLYNAIAATKSAEGYEEVYVYGVSYGTRWVQRYLQVASARDDNHMTSPQSVGVALDGVVDSSSSFRDFDANHDVVGRHYLELCNADELCSSYLGGDAVAFASRTIQGSGCSDFVGKKLKNTITSFLQHGSDIRAMIPAFLYRVDRCTMEDQFLLEKMALLPEVFAKLMGGEPCGRLSQFFSMTPMLYLTVVGSELCENCNVTTEDYYSELDKSLIFSGNVWEGLNKSMLAEIPTYDLTEEEKGYATTGSKVLFLTGTLDPQTPPHWGKGAISGINSPWSKSITFANSHHAAAINSEVTKPASWQQSEAALPCGFQALMKFVRNELGAEERLSCLNDLKPVGFNGLEPEGNQLMFSLQSGDLFASKVDSPALDDLLSKSLPESSSSRSSRLVAYQQLSTAILLPLISLIVAQ